MTRSRETKSKILGLLRSRRLTLTDICAELGLAPSTINQHLKGLLESGSIRKVDNGMSRKWKYYEAAVETQASVSYGSDKRYKSYMV